MSKRVSGKIFFGALQLAGMLLLAACAPGPRGPDSVAAAQPTLVYPDPPDEPRFYFERSVYGDSSVVPEDDDNRLRRLLTGVEARDSRGLTKPYGVAVYRGRIFVSDPAARHVRAFDVPNRRSYIVGDADGLGQLTKPMGLSVDGMGNLYVADATANVVVVFDKDGNFLRRIGGAKWLTRVVSVAADPKGERIYVVDIGGVRSENHRVRVFNAMDGRHLFDIGGRGSVPGQFNFPYGVVVGKEGRVYVVDAGNFRVQAFDRDGKYLSSFGSAGKQHGNFARPKQIAADVEGNLYVVDAAFANFQMFNPDGQLLMFIGQHSNTDGPGRYSLPSGIAVDEDGRVYLVDQWFKKVDIFRPARLKPEQGHLAVRGKSGAVKK